MDTVFGGRLPALRGLTAMRRHDETGLLLRGASGLVLSRDGGGSWQLDAPRSAEALVGRRVRVTGQRIGFDRLSVDTLTPSGAAS